jgi:hypothetical protein
VSAVTPQARIEELEKQVKDLREDLNELVSIVKDLIDALGRR